ncbi:MULTISPECIES: translesion error-prone DNA polymerase V autoproteolytic subunit [Pantoea]|uniref:Translesion error-prone DNA polymerase V autoproteolytic subunit n=1 Tax=Pantoea trifolii TaxID=2968030 RepID=A0ABT1VS36_9GAMM|nr:MULTISPECIES: translesion error-prone DNA polymerase V autoproteolytic subunit [unclassified Pantoea]MCQ8230363.1 translesion error-prone DNA polymerase V autoproteolytic subunit [Pantoea sp. MMK2]MCQ8239206.1 translesion error-prone DNA polymerase V autoproteolytic subunit [Pantoea sp. MMK3]NWA63457.1 translesion error-prone DNA polymerase V autoproteolytic subunit [Pantoea sp. B9002]
MKPATYASGLTFLWAPNYSPPLKIPLFADACSAGFPSPAQDYVESELDLNELCIRRRASTFFVRASGSSMEELGLFDGDVMVVDRAEEANHNDIVIAEVAGEFTVKRLQLHPRLALLPMNPAYSAIYPDELQLLGVVTWFFSSTRARRR